MLKHTHTLCGVAAAEGWGGRGLRGRGEEVCGGECCCDAVISSKDGDGALAAPVFFPPLFFGMVGE